MTAQTSVALLKSQLNLDHDLDDALLAHKLAAAEMWIGNYIGGIFSAGIRQSAHPVLRHHFDSVVASRSESGLTRMHKGKKTDRIDGAVACAMAVHRASAGESNKSQYSGDDAEIFTL